MDEEINHDVVDEWMTMFHKRIKWMWREWEIKKKKEEEKKKKELAEKSKIKSEKAEETNLDSLITKFMNLV